MEVYKELLEAADKLVNECKYENACQVCLQAIEQEPERVDAYYNLALIYHQQGDVDNAIKFFRQVVSLKPQDASASNNLGVLYYSQQNWEKAKESFKNAVNADPAFIDARLNLIKLYRKLENFDQAKAELRECHALQPDNENLKQLRNRLLADIIRAKNNLQIQIVSLSDLEKNAERKLRWGDYWFKKEMQDEFRSMGHVIANHKADVLVHLFGAPLKQVPVDTYNILWIHSHPDWVTPEILKQYDKIYCLSPLFIEKIEKMGFKADLMVGATGKIFKSQKIEHQVVFVGNAKGDAGRKIVRDLGDLNNFNYDLAVWGEGWDKAVPAESWKGLYFSNEDLDKLYAASEITLNDHHDDMQRNGFINPRVLDVMASGGFVVSEFNPAHSVLFGDIVSEYKTPQELLNLVDFYINNPQERQKKINQGVETAQKYTFRKCVQQILADLDTPYWRKNMTEYEQYIEKADLAKKQGDFEKAVDLLNNARALDDNRAEAFYNLGWIYAQLENTNYAIENYEKALHIQQDDTILTELGALYSAKADESYKKALALNPQSDQAQKGLVKGNGRMASHSKTNVTIIAGAIYSGTSMVAKICKDNGIWLGDTLDSHGIKKDYKIYENARFLQLCKNALGMEKDLQGQDINQLFIEFFQQLPKDKPVVLKFPESFYLLDHMKSKLGLNFKVIYVMRNPYQRALSYQKRTNALNYVTALHDWNEAYIRLSQHTKGIDVYTILYERFFTEPEIETKKMLDFIGVDYETVNVSSIDKGLKRF